MVEEAEVPRENHRLTLDANVSGDSHMIMIRRNTTVSIHLKFELNRVT